MAIITPQRFEILTENIAKGVHNFFASPAGKILLSTVAPNLATAVNAASITQIAAANGYPSGGLSVTLSATRTGGVTSVTASDVTLTAAGGAVTFRYATIVDDVPSGDPVIAVLDYGSNVTVNDGDPFLFDFGASFYTLG